MGIRRLEFWGDGCNRVDGYRGRQHDDDGYLDSSTLAKLLK